MMGRTMTTLSTFVVTLFCSVEAHRQLRASSTSTAKQEDVQRPSNARDLWGTEYKLGALLDEQRQPITVNNGNHPPTSLGDLQRADFEQLDMLNPLIGRVVPVDILPVRNPLQGSLHGTPRIVGGTDESNLEPFTMPLRYDETDNQYKFAGCGGTLISNCHVLTAAHCVTGDREGITQAVYVNAWRPFDNNSDGTISRPYHFSAIAEVVYHPGFVDATNVNDVAIMTMSTCTSDFEPIEIADATFMEGVQTAEFTKVAGFGQVADNNTAIVDTLQSVDVLYIEKDDCSSLYYGSQIMDDMVCAGYPQGGRDSCQGDSGGPLYMFDAATGIHTQLGIVSWGIGCAKAAHPGVYTSVAYHYEYIKSIVCSYGKTDKTINLCSIPSANVNEADVSCFAIGTECHEDLDCCGSSICHRRDGVCANPPREEKGRLSDGYGGAGGTSGLGGL